MRPFWPSSAVCITDTSAKLLSCRRTDWAGVDGLVCPARASSRKPVALWLESRPSPIPSREIILGLRTRTCHHRWRFGSDGIFGRTTPSACRTNKSLSNSSLSSFMARIKRRTAPGLLPNRTPFPLIPEIHCVQPSRPIARCSQVHLLTHLQGRNCENNNRTGDGVVADSGLDGHRSGAALAGQSRPRLHLSRDKAQDYAV